MKKKICLYILLLFIGFLSFAPIALAADETDGSAADDKTVEVTRTQISELKDIDCTIIGPEIMGWIKTGWYIIIILGGVALCGMTLIDVSKAVSSGDDEDFKNVWKKFVKRMIAYMLLIILPVVIDFFFGYINDNFSTCINE